MQISRGSHIPITSHRNRTKKSTEKKGSIALMVYVKETTTCPKLTLVKTENICHHLDQSRIRLCIKRKQQKFTINSHQTKKILASVKYKSSLTLTHHQCLEQTIFTVHLCIVSGITIRDTLIGVLRSP